MRLTTVAGFFAALVALSACGDTVEQRAASGGLGGAAVGTAVGGPLVGAAVGATTGAATAE